jgi:hypothetical protein
MKMPYLRKMTATDVVEPSISGDPLSLNVELPLTRVYHPLGFSLEVITNSEEVLAAAEESWGTCEQRFPGPPVQLRVVLQPERSEQCPPTPVHRAQKDLLAIVADARNFAVCERDQGVACAWIDVDASEHRDYLRYHFLEAIAFILLSSSRVIPLHAACVELEGKGVLLCGNSGAGKSSLAFGCARAGWSFISDDASYLVRNGSGRLVAGNSKQVRLRPSAGELFPEVKKFGPAAWTPGKPTIKIPTGLLPGIKTASHANVEYIIFLNRSKSAAPKLAAFSRRVAMSWARQSTVATGARDEDQDGAIRNLLTAELLEFRYSGLETAIECLEKVIGSI